MYNTTAELFKGICDAVREKDSTTALINHQDIPERIAKISVYDCQMKLCKFTTSLSGGITIDNLDVSGFNGYGGIFIHDFAPGDNPWEIQVKFRLDKKSVKSRNFIIGSTLNPTILDVPYLTVRDNNTAIGAGIPDGKSGFGQNGVSNYAFSINTDYWIKLIYDKSKYAVYISTDGTLFEDILEIDYTEAMQQANNVMKFGAYGGADANSLSGSIDLKETWIKINGELWQ